MSTHASKLLFALLLLSGGSACSAQHAKATGAKAKHPNTNVPSGSTTGTQEQVCKSPTVDALQEVVIAVISGEINDRDSERARELIDSSESAFAPCGGENYYRWLALRIEALCLAGEHRQAEDARYAARSLAGDLPVLEHARSFCEDILHQQTVQKARQEWDAEHASSVEDTD